MLLTKLHIPSPGKNLVHRSSLFEKLNEGLKRKLTLISAPAGFGKTTLISDWINQHKIPTAWFSLDKSDNDPVNFLSYIISGIQNISTKFGLSALTLLKSSNKPSIESITSLLINDVLNINQNFLLVLDDFHLISSYDILKLVPYLLEHIPDNMHVVISTRSDPALPLSRIRSQHQLVEIRASELCFSANDIYVLFNKKLKIKLSVENANSLETKTEGWIAGLQLTALSMQGREDISEFIHELKGDNRYIMDYLIEEVLKIQTDDIKDFLLQTSILKQISAPLCNAVLNRNNSQLILEKLEKNNMFVFPLDAERHWYRYHHLFADLLKQRLLLKDKSTLEELHNKACEWFEQNKMYELAIEHALEINNYEKSIQLLGEIVESMWENGLHSAIMKYGDLLPDELIKKNPDFCLYYSWILITAGQIQKAESFLLSAEKITRKIINNENSSKEDVQYNKKLLGKISVAFAFMNSFVARPKKIFDYSKTAMENLSEEDPLWFSWGWYSIGMANMASENFRECIEALNNALEYGKKSGNVYLISTIAINIAYIEQRLGHYKSAYKTCSGLLTYMKESGYSQLTKAEWTYAGLFSMIAFVKCMWTEFNDALENLNIAYDLCKNEKNIAHKTLVLLTYSLVYCGRGDMVEAVKKMNELDEIMKQHKTSPYFTSSYISVKGFFHIELNQLDKANIFFKENGLGLDKKISYLDENGYIPYAHLLIKELKIEEAEILISKLYKIAQAGNRIERIIELKILYAILYEIKGSHEKAIQNLIESLEYAANENIILFHILHLDKINDLLKETYKIQATTKTKIPKKLLDKIKLAIEKREKLKKVHAEAELSSRELDTLQLIAEDFTNQEIADKLFISLNTVKTHVRNILLKLEVDNRLQAVVKAKKLGII